MQSKDYCQCENICFEKGVKPIARFICHCNLCQNYMNQNSNDESFFKICDVRVKDPKKLILKRNYSGFSPLKRAICKACNKPVVSFFNIGLLKFTLLPSSSVPEKYKLNEISMHGFYKYRANNVDDKVPKYYGYWRSQIMTLYYLIIGLIKYKKATPES